MIQWGAVLEQGGPWAVLFVVVTVVIGGLLFAFSRGILVRGSEVERIERRIEKDTDRVLALYLEQIKTLTSAAHKKDDTIATQDRQIEKLLESSELATQTLDKIVREAEKRGFFEA